MGSSDSHMIGIDSRLEMGSLAEKTTLEIEEMRLVSPQPIDRKISSLETTHPRPISGAGLQDFGCKCVLRIIFRSIKVALFSNKLNLLLPCGPLAIVVDKLTNHHGWVFFLSLLGIIPLAERLGWATEQLAFFTGPTVGGLLNATFGNATELIISNDLFLLNFFSVGGLLNATFGNATELIISMRAMKSGMIRVVQQSLLGSILSNMLLVLGCALLGGGIVHFKREQVFNKSSAAMDSGLLLMAVMGLLFPTVLHFTHTELHFGKSELALSRFSSCVMLVAYVAYIFFQLTSHKHLYAPINEEGSQADGSSDDDEEPDLSKWESIMWLLVLTSLISVLSEYLVNAIEGASVAMNIPIAFISVILLPIVGNAAEHAGAVMFAVKDKLDISLGVAIGSSTQIAMFLLTFPIFFPLIPFTVVVGWITGRPMDLNFQLFETATLIMTVLVVTFMLQEGTSNYFKGLMLLLCYLIVAASFFVHLDPESVQDKLEDHP